MANPHPQLHPENLRPWKPGQSGNPAGPKPRFSLTKAIHDLVESPEFKEEFPRRVLQHMLDGHDTLIKEYWARTEGPADAPQAGINVIVVNGGNANQLDGIAELLKMHAEATGGQVIQLGEGDWQEQTEEVKPEETGQDRT